MSRAVLLFSVLFCIAYFIFHLLHLSLYAYHSLRPLTLRWRMLYSKLDPFQTGVLRIQYCVS